MIIFFSKLFCDDAKTRRLRFNDGASSQSVKTVRL